jgi:hypothetical protein
LEGTQASGILAFTRIPDALHEKECGALEYLLIRIIQGNVSQEGLNVLHEKESGALECSLIRKF